MKKANTITKQHPLFSIHAKTKKGILHVWNFIQTMEGTLVFAGKTLIEKKHKVQNHITIDAKDRKPQFIIEADLSFPQREYAYLPSQYISSAIIEARHCKNKPEQKTFTWLSNIAPLLLAIENKDSLLAAELFNKKSFIFMQYPKTTIKLLEDISVEGLFSWIWGRFDEKAMQDLHSIFEGKCTKNFEHWGVAETFFTSARRRLDISQNRFESIDECMTRFLKTHPGTKLTLGIVGSNHYRSIEKKLHEIQDKKKNPVDIFSSTRTFIEAETNNAFDKNAVALYIEPLQDSDINTVSGYVRKSGAELLRKAYPNKLRFSSRLARLGFLQGGSTGIVVEIVV